MILAALALFCIVAFFSLDFDYQDARMTDDDSGVTVVVSRTSQGRTLQISNNAGEHAAAELMSEWGPDLRTNLYRTADGKLGLIDFGGTWEVSVNPLQLERTRPKDEWEYLGTLLRNGFRTANEEGECMDILMNEPPPPRRSWMYRERC